MIRVNLLRNKVGDATTVLGGGGGTSIGDGSDTRGTLVKVAVIGMFTIGLMFIESRNLSALQAESARLAAQVQEFETQAAAKAKEAESIQDVENQARELEDKLKILKLLSRLRLREVKTLDFIQSSIPEKVWLKTMNFESNKDKLEGGRFSFTGNSVSTEDLTEFAKRLEDSAYLSEVIVMKNQEVAFATQKSLIRDFQFTAQVEVAP